MGKYQVNRPDEAAMRRILQKNAANPEGAIIRLAWQAGLLREELTELTWSQVSFPIHMIEVSGRQVPMCAELEDWLWEMREKWGRVTDHVVFSKRYGKAMLPQAVSRIARRELDREGQTEVRLVDLRHDYIIRQLLEHDWSYVACISGVEVRTLQQHFSDYVNTPKKKTTAAKRKLEPIDEFRLWKILQAEKETPAGLALWLTYQAGLSGNEIVSLTWEQVDLSRNRIRLHDREVHLSATISNMLQSREADRQYSGKVLLSARAKKPIDLSRLSRITRAALIRGGMEQFSLKDLWRHYEKNADEMLIQEWLRVNKTITRKQAMELLGTTKAGAYSQLRQMTDEMKLIRVGAKYYLPGTVVPPEQHQQVVLDYLKQEGFAYRQTIADILHIQDKQSARLLKRLVEQGRIVRNGQVYYLKDA